MEGPQLEQRAVGSSVIAGDKLGKLGQGLELRLSGSELDRVNQSSAHYGL